MSSCIEPSLPKSRRSRARSRGAAMVEGAVVALFLAIVFGCLIGMAGLYKAKLLAMQDARYTNMLNATNNCESWRSYADERPSPPSGQPSLPEQARRFGIDIVRTVQEGGGVSRTTSTKRFDYGSGCDPSQDPDCTDRGVWASRQVSAQSYTTCNEKAVGLNLIEYAADTFDKAVGFFAGDVASLF